jgi:hypothetical protein
MLPTSIGIPSGCGGHERFEQAETGFVALETLSRLFEAKI